MDDLVCSFNDHIRDSVIGGSPFADPRMQGFLTGLHLQVFIQLVYPNNLLIIHTEQKLRYRI